VFPFRTSDFAARIVFGSFLAWGLGDREFGISVEGFVRSGGSAWGLAELQRDWATGFVLDWTIGLRRDWAIWFVRDWAIGFASSLQLHGWTGCVPAWVSSSDYNGKETEIAARSLFREVEGS